MLAGQAAQELVPVLAALLPATQPLQLDWDALEYVPRAHALQLLWPVRDVYCPPGQEVQLATPTPEKYPTPQPVQDATPEDALYWPGAHNAKPVRPVVAQYDDAGHEVQEPAPAPEL